MCPERAEYLEYNSYVLDGVDNVAFSICSGRAERALIISHFIFVQDELKTWEKHNNYVRELADELTVLFTKECRLLGQECKKVDLIIEGIATDGDLQTVIGEYSLLSTH